jgi:polysaccharide biosynthesis/export protein
VNLLFKSSFCKTSRSFRLVSLTCCLALLSLSSSRGQAPAPSDDPSAQSSIFGRNNPVNTSNPNANVSDPAPTPASQGQDIDISPSRSQDTRQERLRPQIPFPPQPLSEFQRLILDSTGKTLPIFGANLFNTTPSTFAPVDNIPVTPDYVIGPGDELRLQIWGQINQHGSFVVDRTGSISLPQVGTIHIAGLQFSQVNDFLKSQLARIYRNFDLNVNLGQLRSIQIFVVGQARKPGSYTIGSLSTLLNALFASGGPLPEGSLRDIQVKRGAESVVHFDLYDLLLRGDKSKDIRLEPGDVIFIPNVGPQVAVLGSIATPAVYELEQETSFDQVIALAGGLTNAAAGSHIRVERISDHAQRSELNLNLAAGDNTPVQDGDIVSVNSIVDRFQNAVTLRGNVANPGRFQWHEGMRISDLIPDREMLITRKYYRAMDQLGQTRPEPIGRAPNSNGDNSAPGLAPDATLPDSNPYGTASNTNSNRTPFDSDYTGQTPQGSAGIQLTAPHTTTGTGKGTLGTALVDNNGLFAPSNDVVLSAPDIDWDYAVIERQNAADLTTSLLTFNLAKAVIQRDPSQDLQLLPGDVVTVFSKADIRVPNARQTKFVILEGEFEASGKYSVLPGETLRQLLVRAGGLSPDAYLFASDFTRESVRRIQQQSLLEYADALESQIAATSSASAASALTDRDAAAAQSAAAAARAAVAGLRRAQPTGRIVLNLKPDSEGIASIPDIELQDGDRFIVPRVPATVAVQGQVYSANAFLYKNGMRVKDYLRLAGGPDRIADKKRAYILRADGSVVSRQSSNLGHRALFVDNDFDSLAMYPGDTIIMPPVLEKGATMRMILDISTIVQGFGLGAAAVSVLK